MALRVCISNTLLGHAGCWSKDHILRVTALWERGTSIAWFSSISSESLNSLRIVAFSRSLWFC